MSLHTERWRVDGEGNKRGPAAPHSAIGLGNVCSEPWPHGPDSASVGGYLGGFSSTRSTARSTELSVSAATRGVTVRSATSVSQCFWFL